LKPLNEYLDILGYFKQLVYLGKFINTRI